MSVKGKDLSIRTCTKCRKTKSVDDFQILKNINNPTCWSCDPNKPKALTNEEYAK